MGYQVDQNLYDQALAQLRQKFGQDAAKVFANSWRYATEANDKRAPVRKTRAEVEARYTIPSGLSAEVASSMAKFRETQIETGVKNADDIFEIMMKNHRAGLLQFFTMDGDISQALAEQIVDQCILGKVEA
jgi:hypothetical protein